MITCSSTATADKRSMEVSYALSFGPDIVGIRFNVDGSIRAIA